MKRRLLASLLCAALCTTMVVEAGASAFTDSSDVVFEEYVVSNETAFSGEVTDVVVNTDSQETYEYAVENSMPSEEIVEVEIPVFSDDSTEDAGIEESIVPEVTIIPEDKDLMEEEPEEPVMENQDTEDTDIQEDVLDGSEVFGDEFTAEGVQTFSSEPVSDIMVYNVNQSGMTIYESDWVFDTVGWKLNKPEAEIPETEVPEETVNPEEESTEMSPYEEELFYDLEDGLVRIITEKSEVDSTVVADGYYLFDADGYLVTGSYDMQPGMEGYIYEVVNEYFYMDQAHASLLKTVASGTAKTPYNSNLGQLQKNYWLWTGNTFRYYDNVGRFCSVDALKQSALENDTFKGYFSINGQNYLLDENGTPLTGIQEIKEGNKQGEYYFSGKKKNGIPGRMIRGLWVGTNSKSRWRFYGSDGLRTNYKAMVTKLDSSMGSHLYLLAANGDLVKKEPRSVDGVYYYGDSRGRIIKDTIVTYNGKRYYFSADGSRSTLKNGWYRIARYKNRYYYFDSTGGRIKEKTGWQKINGQWYYFNAAGNHNVDMWTSSGRYYHEDGHLAGGIETVDGVTYFFRKPGTDSPGAGGRPYKKTKISSGGALYYANEKGVLVKNGWVYYNSYYYYLVNYKIQTNTFAKRNGVNGYLNNLGRYLTGWIIINDKQNQVKYVNPNGNDFYKNTTVMIGGYQYRFDSNGYRVNDRTAEISGPYYVQVDLTNCVMTIFSNKYRYIPVKSIRISPGAAGTPTPTGTYWLNRLGRWWKLMGNSWGQYCTHVVGAGRGGIIVHSVPTSAPNIYSFYPGDYYMLGKPASHGCIRCCVADTKWVYDHCQGASIKIFYGTYNSKEVFKGPLGRRPIVPVTGSFDPTDPEV